MNQFLTAFFGGLGVGSIYALLALGFVIIYKSMHVISFAQPAFMMAGAILVSYLAPEIGFTAAVVAGALLIALVALVVERVAIRPMVGKAVFVIAIITIGVDIVVRVVAGAFVGVDPRNIGDPWGLETMSIGGVNVAHRHIAAFVAATLIVAALFAFFRWTPDRAGHARGRARPGGRDGAGRQRRHGLRRLVGDWPAASRRSPGCSRRRAAPSTRTSGSWPWPRSR